MGGMIRDAAVSAADLADQQESAAEAAERDALIAEARQAVGSLPTPDGKTPLSSTVANLTVSTVDMDTNLVVLTDPQGTSLAYQRGEIRLVVDDGGWSVRGQPVRDLADLGRRLKAQAR